jgi:hypothetical protein
MDQREVAERGPAPGKARGRVRLVRSEDEEREAAWWRCACWDCQARRRGVLRLAAILALALAVAGAAVIEYRAWRGSAPASGAVVARARLGLRPPSPRSRASAPAPAPAQRRRGVRGRGPGAPRR